ncbi:MAG: hypothetical protein HOP16_08270 [Acidobacteria bacterium]|nr:hypothetical protein [Acidobacteriota bacterium]
MNVTAVARSLALATLVLSTDASAQRVIPPVPAGQPDLSSKNWIAGGGRTEFNDFVYTADGKKRFDAYDFKKDDPAYGCIGASWTRIYLNPNVVIQITQKVDSVRLQYEWMDIDRLVPLVDPTSANPRRSNVPGHPALGYSAAWYDGDTLVIDTIDMEPGYVTTMVERAGMPQSRRMHTVERLSRQGNVLTIATTHLDPANYRTPVETVIRYQATDWELMKYGCTPEEAAVVAPR